MSEWEEKATDIQIVEKFQSINSRKRVASLWGYHMQVKALYPRLLKILLDGLQHQQECKSTDKWQGEHHKDCILKNLPEHEQFRTRCTVRDPS
jgi:hypothetical protein